jgi:BNR repeat-like domain
MKRTRLMIWTVGLFFLSQAAQAGGTPAIRLTWNSGGSWSPVIAVDSFGIPHVVWYDDTPGNSEIFYKKSTDGGTTWTTSRRLTWTSGPSLSPDIVLDSADSLHLVWGDGTQGNYEIYYMRSTDYGATWTAPKRLTWTSGESGGAVIAADLWGKLHVVWYDDAPGNFEIFYRKSNDGGATWEASRRLPLTSGQSIAPDIVAQSSGNIHVVWADDTPGNNEIYYKKSSNLGTNWEDTRRLTWTPGGSDTPLLVLDASDNLHLIWQDSTPFDSEIYYKKSTNQGKTWTTAKQITWAAGGTFPTGLAADSSDNLHVVWANSSSAGYEIFYKKSTDGGASWGSSHRLSWTSGDSLHPTIAADSLGTLHVVWHDYTPGQAEIYYRRGN